MSENSMTEILRRVLDERRGIVQSFACDFCKRDRIVGYRLKCAECYNYDLCDQCFASRKFNKSHKTGHKVVSFCKPGVSTCGSQFHSDNAELDKLKETYKDAIHAHIKCRICECEPIVGLRYKCDSCVDFNVCETCSGRSFEQHHKSHPLIVYCQTTSLEIDASQLAKETVLSHGGFGTVVYQAKYQEKTVACKVHTKKEAFLRELTAFREIHGDSILSLIAHSSVYTDGPEFVLLMELMPKRLKDLLDEHSYLSFENRFGISTGIACGMARLHQQGFIHGGLTPASVYVDQNFAAKLGDLGNVQLEANNYMPPEFYQGAYTSKLDVFTFGLTLNELFGGSHTCLENHRVEITEKGRIIYEKLVAKCVADDADERPLSRDIADRLSFMNRGRQKSALGFYAAYRRYDEVKSSENKERLSKNSQKQLSFFKKKLFYEEHYNSANEDSRVCTYLNEVSKVYFSEKDAENCVKCCQRLLDKTSELFGAKDHVERAKALARMGYVLLKLSKEASKALDFYRQALHMNERLFGEKSALVANHYSRVGECHAQMNEPKMALEHELKALEIRREIYEYNSYFVVNSLEKVKVCYEKLDDSANYKLYCDEEVRIRRAIYMLKHPHATSYKACFVIRGKDGGRPAWHYVLVEDAAKMEMLHLQKSGANVDVTEFGRILESGWGDDPPAHLSRQYDCFELKFPQFGKFTLANGVSVDTKRLEEVFEQEPLLEYLYTCLESDYEFNNGERNEDVVESLLDIANYYYEDLEDTYNCVLFCETVIAICAKLFAGFNQHSADAYYNMACCSQTDKKEEKALECFRKVLEMRLSLLGEMHPKTSSVYFKMGQCYLKLNRLEEALASYSKCLAIRKHIYTSDCNYYIAFVLNEIAECCEKVGDMEKYSDYRKELMRVRGDLFKLKHPGKEYKDCILVRGKDNQRHAWHYILIENEDNYLKLKRQAAGCNINVTDYGRVVRSGWGRNPSDKIVNEINVEYGFEMNF